MERGKQGGEVFDRQQYLESVGCWLEVGLREMAPEYVQNGLGAYFTAQDRWIEASNIAADAEAQYIQLMGETSRERKNKGSNLFPDYVTTGYGKTLAAGLAVKAEGELREVADSVSKEALDWSKSDVEYAVWNSLSRRRGSTEPTQLNVLEYAACAWSLIETARERAGEPLVVIRKRFPTGPAPGVAKGEQFGFSDLIAAENFEFSMSNAGNLELVLNGVKRAKFEEYRQVSYGGRRGLIGSAQFEEVWAPTKDQSGTPEVVIEDFSSYVIPDILGSDFHQRYLTLQTLGNLASTTTLVDQLDLKTYARGANISFSGQGDSRKSSERQIGFISGLEGISSVEQVTESEDIHDSHAKWVEDLNLALLALRQHALDNSRSSLLRRAADSVGAGGLWD